MVLSALSNQSEIGTIQVAVESEGLFLVGIGSGVLLCCIGFDLLFRLLSGTWIQFHKLLAGVALLVVTAYLSATADAAVLPARPGVGSLPERWFWLAMTLLCGLGALLAIKPVWTRIINSLTRSVSSGSVRRRWSLLLLLLVVVLAPVTPFIAEGSSFGGWTYFYRETPAWAIRTVLTLVLVVWWAGVLVYCRERGVQPSVNRAVIQVLMIAGASILFPVKPEWLGLPVKFFLGFIALRWVCQGNPRWLLASPSETQSLTQDLAKRLRALSEARSLESAYRTFRRTQVVDLAKNATDLDEFRSKDNRWRETLIRSREESGSISDQREALFAFGPEPSAWENGVRAAKISLLVAAPWIAIGLKERLDETGGMLWPLWDVGFGLLQVLATWGGIGFLFGYLFPYLRGRSGLEKALWFVGALLSPLVIFQVLRLQGATSSGAFLFWAVQLFIHCMILGLFAFDFSVLKRADQRDWRGVFEVHGLPALGASLSSILLALGTAAVTLLSAQASEVVTEALKLALSPLSGLVGPLSHP
jgi:hypothetical protein